MIGQSGRLNAGDWLIARLLYGGNGGKDRVTIFLNGQIIIVLVTCKPHTNDKYSLLITTLPISSSKLLYFGSRERLLLSLYDRYDHIWKPDFNGCGSESETQF